MSGTIDKEFRPLVKQLKKIEGVELKLPKGKQHTIIFYHGRRVGSLPTSAGGGKSDHGLRTQLRKHGVPI